MLPDTRNKLYAFVTLACLAGYGWLCSELISPHDHAIGFCPLRYATGLPCPSCGTTRAVVALLHGDVMASVGLNPFGIPVTAILLFAPLWIAGDVMTRRHTFIAFYRRAEHFLKRPAIAIPLAALVLANWVWTIIKDL